MATTSSFSKGCFVFKATNNSSKASGRSPRKKSRKSTTTVTNDSKTVSSERLFSKCDKSSTNARLNTYRETWDEIRKKSEEIITDSHQQLLSDIKNFVEQSLENASSSIPTALVALGVNLPDHSTFFNLLESKLTTCSSPYIAMLSSKECPSLKHMVQKTIQKLMRNADDGEQDLDETAVPDENDDTVKPVKSASRSKTFSHLSSWYSDCDNKRPLIIILQDLESFSTQQLQDFVLLCREYRVRNKLPLLFIMGLATTAVLQQQLHHRTSVCLATRSFQSRPSVVLLNHLIEKLFITNENPLKIGPKLIQLLLDGFLYHDLSLNSFMHRVHLIVMQHFITLPVSTLCCPVSQTPGKIKHLSTADLDHFRQLPSFMKFIENNRSKVSLLTDDKQFRQYLLKSIEDLKEYSANFAVHCKMLHSFSQGLPDALFGKTLREVYVTFLTDGGTNDWNQFIRLLGLSSSHELKTRIEDCIDTLKSSSESDLAMVSVTSPFVLFLEELKRLEIEEADAETSTRNKNVFAAQGKKLDKFELKAQLMATAKQGRPVSKFDEICKEIVEWLNTDFVQNLKPPSSVVFHEIFYAGSQVPSNWDILPWIRRQIQPVPRVAISKALSNPSAYLGCTCCNSQETPILPSMPDLCIAYKLHTECGRLINLYDWMVSFNCIIKKDEENDSEEIEPIIQARFIRAVAQLQLLGFIQSSKRKTDHVARLTWGI